MAQQYMSVAGIVGIARDQLQDLIGPPYRYEDQQIIDALNIGINEMGRLRPDIFLDLKFQRPLRKGDINEGLPSLFTTADITAAPPTLVPVPSKVLNPLQWYINGWLQMTDNTDTTDQRAQAFMVKFNTHLMNLSSV